MFKPGAPLGGMQSMPGIWAQATRGPQITTLVFFLFERVFKLFKGQINLANFFYMAIHNIFLLNVTKFHCEWMTFMNWPTCAKEQQQDGIKRAVRSKHGGRARLVIGHTGHFPGGPTHWRGRQNFFFSLPRTITQGQRAASGPLVCLLYWQRKHLIIKRYRRSDEVFCSAYTKIASPQLLAGGGD